MYATDGQTDGRTDGETKQRDITIDGNKCDQLNNAASSPSTITMATAGAVKSVHLYAPLIPYSHDDNARMLQSVAESGGLATNPGFCDVHGEYDMTSWS